MFWLNHHFMFETAAKNIDRWVVQFNILFLSMLALVPFSAGLLGAYPYLEIAGIIYGTNLLLVAISNRILYAYIIKSKNIENGEMSSRMVKQGMIRRYITFVFFTLGIIASVGGMYYLSIILYCIPIVFNNIPSTLDLMEKIFGFEIK